MKTHFWMIGVTAFLIGTACSSPAGDGKAIAKQENACAEKYVERRQNVETEFVNSFDPTDYSSRVAAQNAYFDELDVVDAKYEADRDEISVRKTQKLGRYKKYKQIEEFKTAYGDQLNTDLIASAEDLMESKPLPASVIAKIKTVIPERPDVNKIADDLIGHQLSEGYRKEKCWFPENWSWKIQEGQIENLRIEEVLTDNANEYSLVVSMVLKGHARSFTARAKISYRLPDISDWEIDYVESLGMDIVQTHKYDKSVRIELCGFFGSKDLYITNMVEVDLIVAGEAYGSCGNKKFCCRVPAMDRICAVYVVSSYDIAFVERAD